MGRVYSPATFSANISGKKTSTVDSEEINNGIKGCPLTDASTLSGMKQ